MAKTRSSSKSDGSAQTPIPNPAPATKKTTKVKKPATRKASTKRSRAVSTALNAVDNAPSTASRSSDQGGSNVAVDDSLIDPQLLNNHPIDNQHDIHGNETQVVAAPTVVPTTAPPPPPPAMFAPASFVAPHRPVTFIANPTVIYNSTFNEYDNEASNVEGSLLSTLHHHQMIISGHKSHIARKMVQPRLAQHFDETCDDIAAKIPSFEAAKARAHDRPFSFFRDRIFNLLANGLIVQYTEPQDAALRQILLDNCKMEARSWTLELLEGWDSHYRQDIKDNEGLRTEAQSHLQLPSK